MLGILGALKTETSSVRRQMTSRVVHQASACPMCEGVYRGRTIVLATTGMGRERAEDAARCLLGRHPISLLISIGFAGALTDDLAMGDIVLGSPLKAVSDDEGKSIVHPPLTADQRILSSVEEGLVRAAIPFHVKVGVTVPDLICDPAQRAELAAVADAQVVDMESYWIARIAAQRDIPFITIRAISDTSKKGLLPFTQMMAPDGQWKAKETVRYFIRRPRYLARLLPLAGEIRRAKKSLAHSIESLVEGLSEEQAA